MVMSSDGVVNSGAEIGSHIGLIPKSTLLTAPDGPLGTAPG